MYTTTKIIGTVRNCIYKNHTCNIKKTPELVNNVTEFTQACSL